MSEPTVDYAHLMELHAIRIAAACAEREYWELRLARLKGKQHNEEVASLSSRAVMENFDRLIDALKEMAR